MRFEGKMFFLEEKKARRGCWGGGVSEQMEQTKRVLGVLLKD